jgi:hypothetical protein
MAVTDDNGKDLLRVPVQEPGGSTAEQGESTGGCGTRRSPDLPGSPADVRSALDSEAASLPGVPGDSERLGIQGGDPFPAVTGNRPQALVPRYPQPVELEGEALATQLSQPQAVTVAWIRGQVDNALWQKHWTHGGRITPAMINEYYRGLCKGYSQASIRRRLGISDSTWYEWGKAADKGGEIHRLFRRVVESGLGNIEGKVVDAWVSKVPDDWRAAQEFLKTRFPQDWNPNVQVEVSGTVHHQHEGRLSLDDDDLLKVASILQQHGVLDTPAGDVVDAEVVDG